MNRIQNNSPDDASQKSKKKKARKLTQTVSQGRTSMNDSAIEGLSQGNLTQSGFNDSVPRFDKTNLSGFVGAKAKPRDFKANPIGLKEINAQNYDSVDDMGQL